MLLLFHCVCRAHKVKNKGKFFPSSLTQALPLMPTNPAIYYPGRWAFP
jgi:hypothetical protein